MQQTRQQILGILRERQHATVDEIVTDLQNQRGSITPVTVRHHLARLQDESLVTLSENRNRKSPGRPQHIYMLTHQGETFFPNNYKRLAEGLLDQIVQSLPQNQVNVILEGVAHAMSTEAAIPQGTLLERLQAVVEYLNKHGYEASWEQHPNQGYLLHTYNCPYHHLANTNQSLCLMDMHLITQMLGVIPRLNSHIAQGDGSCSYLIPNKS